MYKSARVGTNRQANLLRRQEADSLHHPVQEVDLEDEVQGERGDADLRSRE